MVRPSPSPTPRPSPSLLMWVWQRSPDERYQGRSGQLWGGQRSREGSSPPPRVGAGGGIHRGTHRNHGTLPQRSITMTGGWD